jgi:hypothetical protein
MLHNSKILEANDRDKFVTIMQQEVSGLCNILRVIPKSLVPDGVTPLQKYKAYLNAHGSK